MYEVHRRRDHRRFAFKLIPSTNPEVNRFVKREFNALSRLRHPNIVAYHAIFECEQQLGLLMEYVDGLYLDRFLQNQSQNKTHSTPAPLIDTETARCFSINQWCWS